MENPEARDPQPCAECPAELLNEYLASAAGRLIQQTVALDFALRAGVHVTLGEISYPEFLSLQCLVEERQRYEREMIEASGKRGVEPHLHPNRP
jgi:chromosome condensin MukBEF MukE localization factor